jgi:hypothetical protein
MFYPFEYRREFKAGGCSLFKSIRLPFCVCTLLLIGSGSEAQTPFMELSDQAPAGVMVIEPRIRLEPVSIRELLPTAQAISAGHWSGSASSLTQSLAAPRLVRRVPSMWRIRLPESQAAQPFDVQYSIEGADGTPGRLTSESSVHSSIAVQLRPIPPLTTRGSDDSETAEGGVVLYLDLEDVRSAGRYRGTMTVTVHQF